MTTSTRVLLIRHGEAHCNVDGVDAGHDTCRGLTDTGREQASSAGRWLAGRAGLRIDALLSSLMPRSIETADVLATALPSDTLREADCAFCERHPPLAASPDAASPGVGGETSVQFAMRVHRALRAIERRFPGATIAIATHHGFITRACFVAEGEAFGDALAAGRIPRPPHASVTVLTSSRSAPGPPGVAWHLERYAELPL